MDIVQIDIAGEPAYRVNETVYCRVAFQRPVGAAPSMYGCLAVATAIYADGEIQLGANGQPIIGSHTASTLKTELLANPTGLANTVATDARDGAIARLLQEVAVQAANAEVGI